MVRKIMGDYIDQLGWSLEHLKGCAVLLTSLIDQSEPIEDSALLVITNDLTRTIEDISKTRDGIHQVYTEELKTSHVIEQ